MSASALYRGYIRHRRFGPTRNDFRYRIYLWWIDLAELPQLFASLPGASATRPAPIRFKREDYLGDPAVPLDQAVRDRIEAETGRRPQGAIRLLAHIRQFGYTFNPVSFYYVYDEQDRLETVVAEITNTPWDERHAYVLPVAGAERVGAEVLRWQFGKAFHVSPFLPMDMRYDWRFSLPGDTLHVHMENWREDQPVFDATLTLSRQPLSAATAWRALLSFPLMTFKVSALIYWQALKLLLKRTPFHTHPDKLAPP